MELLFNDKRIQVKSLGSLKRKIRNRQQVLTFDGTNVVTQLSKVDVKYPNGTILTYTIEQTPYTGVGRGKTNSNSCTRSRKSTTYLNVRFKQVA